MATMRGVKWARLPRRGKGVKLQRKCTQNIGRLFKLFGQFCAFVLQRPKKLLVAVRIVQRGGREGWRERGAAIRWFVLVSMVLAQSFIY